MIPRLYNAEQTDFSGLGLGGLGDAQKCQTKWQLNGAHELEMQYPVIGRRFPELKHRQIITATTGPEGTVQPFRIYRITRPLQGVCTVYARHIAYDLMGHSCDAFTADGIADAVAQVQEGAVVQPHGFTIATELTSTTPCVVPAPRSIWSMLGGMRGSLLDIYGGEWDFDGFSLTLRERIGRDSGVTVRYGKNLRSLEQDENLSNTWTAVHPFWLSPDEDVCVTLDEKTVPTGTFDYVRVMVLDLSAEFVEAPTQEQLRSRTKSYISSNKVGIPDVGFTVDFVPLDQVEEFKGRAFLSAVCKGDTVAVEFPTAYHPTTGLPRAFVTASSRVVETVWLPMEDRYKSIRLGKKRANFVSTLVQVQKDVSWLMTKRS